MIKYATFHLCTWVSQEYFKHSADSSKDSKCSFHFTVVLSADSSKDFKCSFHNCIICAWLKKFKTFFPQMYYPFLVQRKV